MSTPAPNATLPTQRPVLALLALFASAFAVALAIAVALNAGPRLRGTPPVIEVPGKALQVAKGRAHVEGSMFVLDALDVDGIALVSASTPTFQADDYTRMTWQIASATRRGVGLTMVWRTRERPGRTYNAPIAWSHGVARIDLRDDPNWTGSIHGVALAVSGPLDTPLAIAGFSARSNAWDATLADVVRAWTEPIHTGGRGTITQMGRESEHIAPMLAVVAGALGLGIALLVVRARRRKEAVARWKIAALFLIGWFLLDLRWQLALWGAHAASVARFAGKTLDQQYSAAADGAIFEVARKVRDATRDRSARILVLSDNGALRTRIAWFLYPQNVYYDARTVRRATIPAPDQLRPGDQVVLLLYSGISWDAERQLLKWTDGRTRPARAILSDGPQFALIEVT